MPDGSIESWLSSPAHRLSLRFPKALEDQFEVDTGGERSRSMAVFSAPGFLFGAAIYPALRSDIPDMASEARLYFLFLSIPIGLLVSVLLWFRPPPRWREGLTLSANLVCICVSMSLCALSHRTNATFVLGGTTILMVYSAIGIQLRFGYAITALASILTAYGLALLHNNTMAPQERADVFVLTLVTAVYLGMANWRLERAERRAYLLLLRERLGQKNLTLRNIELDQLTRRDALTGLANRRAYDTWLDGAWAQEAAPDRQGRGRIGLIVLDVDRFKLYNDFYGHAAGDNCLKTVAVCLREQLRGTTDLVARLGGEEFAVLLPGMSEETCADVGERLRAAVQRLELPHCGLGPQGLVSISAGVASVEIAAGATQTGLFQAADAALYQAKMSGRNRVCVATIGMPATATAAASAGR